MDRGEMDGWGGAKDAFHVFSAFRMLVGSGILAVPPDACVRPPSQFRKPLALPSSSPAATLDSGLAYTFTFVRINTKIQPLLSIQPKNRRQGLRTLRCHLHSSASM
uniref:Predicted protein n=1 Tax=Hordeum vulgare subsp. vulgare TaxID=112509 RepID=F2DGF4_HORVV|nr:predicted protein [Hordeum vulgare subsp. vulgare]